VPGFTIARVLPPVRVAAAFLLLLTVSASVRAGSFAPSETIFPDTTRAWLSVPDPDAFRERFDRSSYGQLVADPAMKVFIDSIREQVSKNGRQRLEKLGLTLDDLEKIPGGEIAIGAIEAEPGRLSTLLLVDTTGHEAEAKALVDRIKARLLERKATVATIAGAPASMAVYALPDDPNDDRVAKNRRVAFALEEHALLVGDDAQQVGQALGVLATGRKESLASLPAFGGALKPCQTALPESVPSLRWFVDPLGFAKAWQASRSSREKRKGPDYVTILSRQGFDAVQAAGGLVTFSDGAYGIRHHTMIYAPPLSGRQAQSPDCYDAAARMLRFPSMGAPRPPSWVPRDAAGWSTLQWDLKAAFVAAEPLVDDVVGDKGVYDDVIASLKEDPDGPQIDVEKDLVDCLTGRITVVTDHVAPSDPDAERLVIALEAADEARVAETIAKVMNADSDMRKIEINGNVAWEIIDRSAELPELDVDIAGLASGPPAVDPVHDPDDEAHRRRARLGDDREEKLLPHSSVSVALGHLFIASHRDILEQVLAPQTSAASLGGAGDFTAAVAEVDRLLPGGKSSMTFIREDRSLQPAYELLRQGAMPKSKSVFGQLLNGILGDGKPGTVREQKIDGSSLPEFEVVRRYLGTAALALESRPDGWIIAGMSLPRAKPDAGVAQKPDARVDR
jgi:hypothetical protein